VSQKSREIAQSFQRNKERLAATTQTRLAEKQVLDEGFRRLRDDLEKSIPPFCDELNGEPEIGNILECGIVGDKLTITHQDTGDSLAIKFDAALHKVTFSCDKPVKYREPVEVRVVNVTGWWFATKDGSSAGSGDDSVFWLAEKAVRIFLGAD